MFCLYNHDKWLRNSTIIVVKMTPRTWYAALAAPANWCSPTFASLWIFGLQCGRKSRILTILAWHDSTRLVGIANARVSIAFFSSGGIEGSFHVRWSAAYASASSSAATSRGVTSKDLINSAALAAAPPENAWKRVGMKCLSHHPRAFTVTYSLHPSCE